jgi:hypothetical protein
MTKQRWLFILFALFATVVVGIVVARNPALVRFWPFTPGEFVQAVTPLLLVALFVERALEIVIGGLYGGAEAELKKLVKEKQKSDTDLLKFKASTRRVAFAGALVFGLTISAIGVRGLELFVDPAVFDTLTSTQRTVFRTVDVLVTASLIAGGADGMHKLVSVFTNGMDKINAGLKQGTP